jgi:hypothetical protein
VTESPRLPAIMSDQSPTRRKDVRPVV